MNSPLLVYTKNSLGSLNLTKSSKSVQMQETCLDVVMKTSINDSYDELKN